MSPSTFNYSSYDQLSTDSRYDADDDPSEVLTADSEALLDPRRYPSYECSNDNANNSLTGLACPRRQSVCRILVSMSLWFSTSMMTLLLAVEIVPAQVESMVGNSLKGTVLGVMVGVGAVLSFVLSPVIGMWSDTKGVCGRRKPVIVISCLGLCIGLFGMSFGAPALTLHGASFNSTWLGEGTPESCRDEMDLQERRCATHRLPGANDQSSMPVFHYVRGGGSAGPLSYVGLMGYDVPGGLLHVHGYMGIMVACYLLIMVCATGISVPYNALIADGTHTDQRGLTSGIMGGMVLAGNLAGAILGLFVSELGLTWIYLGLAGALLLGTFLVLIVCREEPPTNLQEPGCSTELKAFKTCFKNHDFRWLFFTRFLMQQGVATIFTFVEYWLTDMVAVPRCWDSHIAVAVLTIPLQVAAAICSVAFGLVSDKIRRRKPLVTGAAWAMSTLTAGFIAVPYAGRWSYYLALVLVFLNGLAYGGFLSVDFALLLDILNDPDTRAKHVAIWHQALLLPQILATPIGGLILDFFEPQNCSIGLGYIILFSLTASYLFLSGVCVTRLKVS